MKEKWYIFCQTYFESPEVFSFDTKKELEEFLNTINWENNKHGANIFTMIKGVELKKEPREKVKSWGVFEK